MDQDGRMLHRWTLWESENGEPVQLSLCLLDALWEPLYEATLPCGPFHTAEERRLELLDGARRWLAHRGYQLSLGDL